MRKENGVFNTDVCLVPQVTCSSAEASSMFRSITGRCNNIAHPLWGTTGIPFRRILKPCERNILQTRNTLLNPNRLLDEVRQAGPGGNNGKGKGTNAFLRLANGPIFTLVHVLYNSYKLR